MEINIDNVKEIKLDKICENNTPNGEHKAYRIIEFVKESGETVEITISGKSENLIFIKL